MYWNSFENISENLFFFILTSVVSVSHTFHFQALLFLVSESEVEALEAMVHKLEDGNSSPNSIQ